LLPKATSNPKTILPVYFSDCFDLPEPYDRTRDQLRRMLAWMQSNEPYDTTNMKLCKYVEWRQHADKIRKKRKALKEAIDEELTVSRLEALSESTDFPLSELDLLHSLPVPDHHVVTCKKDLDRKTRLIVTDDDAILLEKREMEKIEFDMQVILHTHGKRIDAEDRNRAEVLEAKK
jgi:hypothetical protein